MAKGSNTPQSGYNYEPNDFSAPAPQTNTYGANGAFGGSQTGIGTQGPTSTYGANGAFGKGIGEVGTTNPTQTTGGMPSFSGQTIDQFLPQPQQQDPYAGLFGGGGGGGSYSFNFAQPAGGGGENPYLDRVATGLTERSNRNLNENILPGINRSANMVGGYGGARQGLAQGKAIGDSQAGLDSTIANMYSNSYENEANRRNQAALTAQGLSSQMEMARMSNQTNNTNSLRNFYSTNRGQDLQELLAGSGLMQQGNAGLLGQGQGIWGLGQQEQGADQNQLSWLSSILGPYSGLGQSGTGSQQYQYNPSMQWAGTAAQVAGIMASAMMSDASLKENIKRVGKTDEGLGVYTYNYKGDQTPQMGVLAQEVEQKKPEALGPTIGGFKSVRYGLLGA